MEEIKCEGNCIETHGKHEGEVKSVVVYGNGCEPTNFNYCQNAIDEDKSRGFEVEAQ